MKYKYLILLCVSLLLISCGKEETVQTSSVFIGGTNGVTAQFEPFGVEENNVYSIFDTETFPIELTLRNKGEHDISPGDVEVTLLGPSQQEFTGISSWTISNKDELEGISEFVTEGGEETITFGSDVKYSAPVTGLQERTWFANIE
jgi:hypothetical protein